MKTSPRPTAGPASFDLVEEAVQLLRLNAGTTLVTYYTGSLPFILGLLYFWAEMSRSPYAAQHLTGAALGLALLFVWMKFWQAVFVANLRARRGGSPPAPWTARRAWRMLVIQTAIQPSAMLLLPLALLPAGLLFPWMYAFYQNVTALTDGESAGLKEPVRRAGRQMLLWPTQNILILFILGGFSLVVLLNLASVFQLLPHLLKMLLGVASVYTQSTASLFNSTFAAAMFGLTYLCVDPLLKTVYLLRCYYGEARQTGADLKAELRQFALSARTLAAGLMLAACIVGAAPVSAAEEVSKPERTGPLPPRPIPAVGVSAPTLDQAINEVIRQPKYTWRLPREKIVADDSGDNVVVRFFKDIFKTLGGWLRDFVKWILDWLEKWLRRLPIHSGDGGAGGGWTGVLQVFLFVLLAAVLSVLAVVAVRAWQQRHRPPPAVTSEAILAAPDITDENLGADELPEDGWSRLGRELLGRGELRLALRAFYFASLAHLAGRNLVSIAKFKSNRDYERELARRGHALPDVLALFGENVSVFDRSWYGLREVDPEIVGRFLANVERIKTA